MLVLTRKPGERVLIGDDIVVTFLETRGDGIRIGIEAPRGLRIQRGEIIEAVSESNRAASQVDEQAEDRLMTALGLSLPSDTGDSVNPGSPPSRPSRGSD